MAAAKAEAIAPEGEATIITTRTLDAPRDLVWKVWTDPAHVGKWWGPNGFTTTTKSFDFRVGGAWVFTMHGPDGQDWPNRIAYHEIDPPKRLVYSHGDDGEAALFRTVVTFTEDGGKTHVRMMATFPTVAARDDVAKRVHAVEGAAQHLDNMADYVGKLTARSS